MRFIAVSIYLVAEYINEKNRIVWVPYSTTQDLIAGLRAKQRFVSARLLAKDNAVYRRHINMLFNSIGNAVDAFCP